MLIGKTALWYAVLKGVTLALVARFVIADGGLTPTARALIVAFVSGILGIVGIAVGAIISARASRQTTNALQTTAEENRRLLQEIKSINQSQTSKVNELADTVERRADASNVADSGNRQRVSDRRS